LVRDPQPNLGRAGVCTTQLQEESFKRHRGNILRYVGVLVQYLGVEVHTLSLWTYTYMSHFFLYLSFIQARDVQPVELKKQVQTAMMVLGFLENEQGADQEHLQKCSKHLEALSKELGNLHQRTVGVSTNPQVDVPPAGPVLAWQERVITGALQAAYKEMADGRGYIFSPQVQLQVRDATMLGLAFGHATLVTRLPLLRSVKASLFASKACEVEGCVSSKCRGNRLERTANPSYSSTSTAGSSKSSNFDTTMAQSRCLFKLCCAHHKNSSKGVAGFEVTINNPNLHALLVIYEELCRGPILMQASNDLDVEPTTLFFDESTGMPLTPHQLDVWFRRLQVQYELPLPQPMPQTSLRHIMTTDRREHPHLPGPSDQGAALGMGNSLKV
jgi:hypothetical protein